MAFPTTPSNGDEYTNALGTIYKYLTADDKWYIINAPINLNDLAEKDHISLDAKNGEADVQHLTAAQVATLDSIHKHVPPVFQNGGGGFVLSGYRWQVAQNDAGAFMYYSFICPQTRADWKFVLVYNNQYNTNDQSGLLRIGTMADDEPWDDDNAVASYNFDLVVGTTADVYFKESTAFSATVREHINVRFTKDANNGGAAQYLYILGAYLTHA